MSTTAQQRARVLDAFKTYHERRGRLDEAVGYMRQVWRERADYLPPVFAVQLKLSDLGLYAKAGMAQAALDTIAAIGRRLTPPLDLMPPIGSVEVAIELRDPEMIEEAVAGLERLIAGLGAEALRPVVTHARAMVLELQGQCDQAIIGYRRALQLSPTQLEWNTDIGRCQREIGQFDQALESLDRTLAVRPHDADALYEKALVYLDRGDRDRAREQLQAALDVWRDADPDFAPAREARQRLADIQAP
jgi:tetratricopeptide (TPR) repeat protein